MTRRQILERYKRYDPDGHFYSLKELMRGVRSDHPDWSSQACKAEAERILRGLFKHDAHWYYLQQEYHQNVVPWDDTDKNTAA